MAGSAASSSTKRVVEHPAAGREREHAALVAQVDGIDAVEAAQRRVHHVDAQHHPGAAAERRVVDLAAAERRVLARVERAQLVAVGERVADVALAAEPLEPLREEGDDVELHQEGARRTASARAATAQARPRPGSPDRRRPRPPRCPPSAPRRGRAARAGPRPRRAPPPAPRTTAAPPCAARDRPRGPVDHPAALEVLGVPLVLAERRRRRRDATSRSRPRSASAASRPSWPARRRIGRSSVPGAAHDLGLAVRRSRTAVPSASSAPRGRVDVERAVEPVGPADPARREPLDARARHVSRRCRRARGGSP